MRIVDMCNVLIVDDEKSIRISFKKRLERENFIVSLADSWNEVKPLLNSIEFETIFLDIKLPGKSGLQILDEIMKIQPLTTVVMMTGEPSSQTAKIALTNGAFEYLDKPISKDVLLKTIYRSVERKKIILEKQRLENENESFQDKIDELIVDQHIIFRDHEFKKFFDELSENRKQNTKDLDKVKQDLYNHIQKSD